MDEPGVLLMRRVICRFLLARIVILLSLPAMYMARFFLYHGIRNMDISYTSNS